MKHTDLQIEDYVYHVNKIVKVATLSNSDVTLSVTDNLGTYFAIYNNINPIPLTPEILEKNGFVKNKDSYLCKLSDKDSKIAIAYSDLYLDIRRTNPIMTIMVQCMYVHELQHVLKLCKVDKEIIL